MAFDFIKPPVDDQLMQGPASQGSQPPQMPAGLPEKKRFDITVLKQYLHIVVRRIWLVALCFVISVTITVINLMKQVPEFACSSQVMVSRESRILPSKLRTEESQLWGDYIATQQRILQSRMLRQRAIESLARPYAEVAGSITRTTIGRVWQGSILTVGVDSLDPKIGAEYANALSEEYIAYKNEQVLDVSQATVLGLTSQAKKLMEELQKAEERQVGFERDNSIVAIKERGNIAARKLASLAERAAQLRTERMLLEYQQPLLSKATDEIVLQTLNPASSLNMYTPPIAMLGGAQGDPNDTSNIEDMLDRGVVAQPSWVDLKKRKARLESELENLSNKFRDAHPYIQEKTKSIEDVQRQLDVELQFAQREYQNKLNSLTIQEEAAKRVELEWHDEALEISRQSHEFDKLDRQVGRLRNLYDLVFSRLKELDLSQSMGPATVSILERAVPAGQPKTQQKFQSILVGGLVGLLIGLGLVIGLEYIDDSFRYPEEVSQELKIPFYGVVPAANWDPDDLRTHMLSNIDQKSGMAEAYRNVRSAFMFSGLETGVKSLAISSAVPLEGKTTTCLNTAVSLAQAGNRVLLLDGDLRRGELHKFFGLEGGRGLSDVLVGHAKPEAVIQRTGIPNLDLVATGPFPPNPAEIILRKEFNLFLEYAGRTYDKILVDCPPVMAVSEGAILASLMDGVMFVVWAGQTSRRLARAAVQVLRERGGNIVGCILNNLEFGRVGYYYYSTYYGYYDYDDRYAKNKSRSGSSPS